MPVKLRNHTYNFTKRVITAHIVRSYYATTGQKPKELTAMFSNNLVIIFAIIDIMNLSSFLCQMYYVLLFTVLMIFIEVLTDLSYCITWYVNN